MGWQISLPCNIFIIDFLLLSCIGLVFLLIQQKNQFFPYFSSKNQLQSFFSNIGFGITTLLSPSKNYFFLETTSLFKAIRSEMPPRQNRSKSSLKDWMKQTENFVVKAGSIKPAKQRIKHQHQSITSFFLPRNRAKHQA